MNENWLPKVRKSNFGPIPYGYEQKEGDPTSLVPIPEMIVLIEQALDSLDKGSTSLRDAAAWLSNQTGTPISHMGLNKIWKRLRGDNASVSARKNKLLAKERVRKRQSPEHKKRLKLNRAIGADKRTITAAQKRLAKLQAQEVEDLKKAEQDAIKLKRSYVEYEDVPEDVAEEEVVFRPHPGPQTEFLAASEQEVLYGGAAGGGKSYALLADPIRYFDNPKFRGLILRRTNDELRELKWKSKELYHRAFPKAEWREKDSEWRFPSGARLWMTFLERDEDVLRYQGQSFTWIGVDELTQYATPFAWTYLSSRLRTEDPELPVCMRATTNPGGPGHGWVKQMFIDPAPYNEKFPAKDMETGQVMLVPEGDEDFPVERWGQPLFMRRFIPARLSDNPSLAAGGRYKANLLGLAEQQRRQLLDGDWSIADGAAFPEFRVSNHVIKPFEIPSGWRRFRSCDFGYSSFSAVHWYAIDPEDRLYVYRELYVSKHNGPALARAVLEAERGEHIAYGVLDSSCWHNRGQTGPTIAEEMINLGCRWRPSDRSPLSRINGRMRLHELLKLKEDEFGNFTPGIVFFDTCRQIIADLGVIPTDPKGTDDIDDRYKSDHTYDSIRYGIMSRPSSRSVFDWNAQKTEMTYRPADPTFGY